MEDSRDSVRRVGKEKPKMGAWCNRLQEQEIPGKEEKGICVKFMAESPLGFLSREARQ